MQQHPLALDSKDPIRVDTDDYVVRATAVNGSVRCIAIRGTALVEHARSIHGLSAVATAALGRLLLGGAMMTEDLKNASDRLTLRISADGPIGSMIVTGEPGGKVRGCVSNPKVATTYKTKTRSNDITMDNSIRKINVGAAVGSGTLTVIRDLGLKEPYVGQVELLSGEIAEDLAAYYLFSEQVPSVVALGVRLDSHGVVRQAGGLIAQLMPDADEATLDWLEARATGFPDVSDLMEQGFNPHQLLDLLLGDPELTYLSTNRCAYYCPCSREQMERNLLALGKKELGDLAKDPSGINLECHFCNERYAFSQDDVQALLRQNK